MAQLSRPYQFGLLGIVLLAAVWLVLLQGHSSSTSGTGSSASVPTVQTVTTTTSNPAKHAAAPGTKIYHGSAPGVSGLTRAIAKAQGAASTSQQNAKALEEKSAAASNESAAATHPAVTAPAKALATVPKAPARTAPVKTTPVKPSKPVAPNASTRSTVAVNQHIVEAQLAQGKIAVILFWTPKGADDVAVRRAVEHLHGKIGVSIARANQVASFGTITRGIQVYGTPTLLIVNKKGQATTLTGLQDGFAIEQAITEARHS
jgi:hypothetical protein